MFTDRISGRCGDGDESGSEDFCSDKDGEEGGHDDEDGDDEELFHEGSRMRVTAGSGVIVVTHAGSFGWHNEAIPDAAVSFKTLL